MHKSIGEVHYTLLTNAFEKDPMFVHLFSGDKRQLYMKSLFRFLVRRNELTDGLIFTDHIEKPTYLAMVDRPKDQRKVTAKKMLLLNLEMLMLAFKLPWAVLSFFNQYQDFTSRHAPPTPHYYLTMIGVNPRQQGKGIGSQILNELHRICDEGEQHYPIALDTENPDNLKYYERFGYELKGEKSIRGIKIYCMLRE